MQEWFEYGGEPHHFRMTVQSEDTPGYEREIDKVFRLVDLVKRLSSWLDEIILKIHNPPFIEAPGHLVFQRFITAYAFSNRRGGYRFNGKKRFGDDFLFDQDGVGIRFPRFQIASSFSHFNNGIRFDGSADFDGGINFDQAYGFMGLPLLRISGGFREAQDRLCTPSLGSSVKFSHQNGLDFPHLSANAVFQRSESLSGKITIDNWACFDGEINFDGTRTFNAYIKEEEL